MKMGSKYGHKGTSGAYGSPKSGGTKIAPKRVYGGKKMARGPRDPRPSHKGYAK